MQPQGSMNTTKIVQTKVGDFPKKKNKITIIGDSHIRGHAAEIP
jgi:hypothetical protein